jgi:hypothetical protein
MTDRLAAGFFLGISLALLAAAVSLTVFFGPDPALILLCFVIYAGLAGVIVSLRFFLTETSGIESVSMRRARALRDEGMSRVLSGYEVDEEFLGRGGHSRKRPFRSDAASETEGFNSPDGASPVNEELKKAVTMHASLFGGLEQMLDAVRTVDRQTLENMARTAGFPGVGREALADLIGVMVKESRSCSAVSENPLPSISLDRESFDDYIRRCMTDGDCRSDEENGGFSVDLNTSGFSDGPREPSPSEFSHDPRSIMSKLNKTGGKP